MNTIEPNPLMPLNAGSAKDVPKAVFNVAEAARYLTICERKLRELLADCEIRQCRIGRRVVIRRCDLDEFLEAQLV